MNYVDVDVFVREINYSLQTVKPLHNGHLGTEESGSCREVAVMGS